VELSGGYQFLNFSFQGQSESMPLGWYADVAGNLSPMFGVVFQIGGNYKTFDESVTIGNITASASADLKVHEFLGGLRVNVRSNSRVVPFAQVLAGGINGSVHVTASATIPGTPPVNFDDEDSGTDVTLEVGGGANIGLSDGIGLRVGMDYLRVFAEDSGANLFRFHAGVVIGR
jgi:opacity protein-like surface antigen